MKETDARTLSPQAQYELCKLVIRLRKKEMPNKQVAEIVGTIVLIEADNHKFFLTWAANRADIAQTEFDPSFALIDLLFVGRPGAQILVCRAELPGIVGKLFFRCLALPVAAPALERIEEFLAVGCHLIM